MTLEKRIELLSQLGEYLLSGDEFLKAIMHRTQYNNKWLTIEKCETAMNAIAKNLLQKEALKKWARRYKVMDNDQPKKVGLIMTSDIPLANFHDLLAVYLTGNQAIIKLSDNDKFLIPQLINKMGEWEEETKNYFAQVERLSGFDAVIAGSNNNSNQYFERYFGKYPNIIRKNRKAIAVLDGTESIADLYALGNDIFEYFGLGCRNVSKIYVPNGYKFEPLLEALHEYNSIVLNTKYKNNFDYNYAMYMLNKMPYKANGCIILIENETINSRIASLHYEYYDKANNLVKEIQNKRFEIECVVSKLDLTGITTIPFGTTQQPSLMDYKAGVDTMAFLMNLRSDK